MVSATANRDYTLIIDKSGSMTIKDGFNGISRWQEAQETTMSFAQKCFGLDPDGLDVYFFSRRFKKYENIRPERVNQIFSENEPSGTTGLTEVLKDAIDCYFQRRNSKQSDGETIVIITDGQPDDTKSVMELIVATTQKLANGEELGLLFLQVGQDLEAAQFLRALDDRLEEVGAKFDIVDAKDMDEVEEVGLAQCLLDAITD